MRRTAAIAVFLLLGITAAARADDLLQVYRSALRNDATYRAARATFAAALQRLPEARAGLLPRVDLSGSDDQRQASTSFSDLSPVDRRIHTWNWTLKLDQPLFKLDKFYAYREAGFTVEQARARLAQARMKLILRVAKAYFGVLTAQEGLAADNAQIKAMREQLARARHGFRAGLAAVTDVYEAESRLELARAQGLAAANEVTNRRAALQKITGTRPAALAALGAAAVIPRPVPRNLSAWIQSARRNNLAVQGEEAALAATRAGVAKQRAGYLPSVDLTASYGRNYSSSSLTTPQDYSTQYRSWQVGVQVVVPLFAGGATNAAVSGALARRDEALARLQSARRQAAMDARQAFSGIESGAAQVNALKASLRAARGAVKGNAVGYRLGIRINTDVLKAQEQFYATLHELAKARYSTLYQGLKLKAAAGSLSVHDLEALDALLTRQAEGTALSHPDDVPIRPLAERASSSGNPSTAPAPSFPATPAQVLKAKAPVWSGRR